MAARERPAVRRYATDEIVVEWEPRLCYHSHNCVRALPQVFDEEAAAVDQGRRSIGRRGRGGRGALSFWRACVRRIGPAGDAEQPPEVRASANGPLLVRGGVRVLDADGTSSTRARGPRSAAAAARATSRSATARTRRTASRADRADALPGRVVPVLLGGARGADRARDRLRRAPGRALARASATALREVAGTDQIPVLETEDGPIPRHPRDLRVPPRPRAVAARRRAPAAFVDHRDARESDAAGQLIEYFRGSASPGRRRGDGEPGSSTPRTPSGTSCGSTAA